MLKPHLVAFSALPIAFSSFFLFAGLEILLLLLFLRRYAVRLAGTSAAKYIVKTVLGPGAARSRVKNLHLLLQRKPVFLIPFFTLETTLPDCRPYRPVASATASFSRSSA